MEGQGDKELLKVGVVGRNIVAVSRHAHMNPWSYDYPHIILSQGARRLGRGGRRV